MQLNRARLLESEIRDEFEALGRIQVATLRQVLDHLDRTARQGLVGVVVLVIGVVLTAWATAGVLRRRILGPVRAIREASERMRLGDLSARAPAGPSDELGQLTQGFNYMAESLATAHAGLERTVEERTEELKTVQGKLVQAEKLSAIGLLVGGVAHELNNPLAGIVGFNQLARMELMGRPDGAEPLRLLDQVDVQVERCRRIVENLLQFARKQEPHRELFDVNAAVEQMLQLRAYELSTRNTRIVREFDPSNPTVWADRDKIQQVVLNLLNNAADAVSGRDADGTIVVRTRAGDGSVAIEFLDNGTGFEDVERAFDPFYTTKDVGRGTGLGLSVCYGIVREHGGQIEIGNLDRGARVSVCLPALAPGRPEPAPGPAPSGPAQPEAPAAVRVEARRALVVDDEESLLRLQVAFLRKMGIDAHGVISGEAAIRYLETHPVDVIVSDVRMPGVSGVELYEWVRVNRPAEASHFLLTSGDLVGLNLESFFKETGVARINKPFRFEAYSAAVRAAMDGKERMRG
jgi:two-component system NtrC family sensor kinase